MTGTSGIFTLGNPAARPHRGRRQAVSAQACQNPAVGAGLASYRHAIWRMPVKHLFADGAYDRTKLMDKAAYLDFVIEIIKRSDTAKGFEVLPRRWVVERTFGWMTRWRRLVRDYEERIDVSEAMIHIALGSLLLRRIAH